MPTVSVIIPTHNRSAYLGRALHSVLQQTFADWEVIVVDDGSVDETVSMVRAFADPRIELVQQTHQERAVARNLGLQRARGQFIAFLDDDDVWTPRMLERTLGAFCTDKVGVVYTGWRCIDEADRVLPQASSPADKRGTVLRELLFGCWFPASAALVRRSSLTRTGEFDATVVPVEDWDLWIRTAAHGDEFNAVSEPLLLYRLHDQNSTRALDRMATKSQQLLDKAFATLGSTYADARVEAFARLDCRNAVKRFGVGQTELGSQLFARAVAALPLLLEEAAPYYEIICAMQPDGYKGTTERLDLALGREYIESALAAACNRAALQPQRARAYANAYVSLAWLHYGQHEMTAARRYFRMGVRLNPLLLTRANVPWTWSKSFLPPTAIGRFKRWRGSHRTP